MLVSSQISGHALKFSSRALTRSHGWDTWLPWQELPSSDSPTMAPPGTATASEPTSSLKTGSALPGDSPSTLTWQAGAPGPFPGCPCPMHCPRGQWRPGPRIMRVTHAHYAIPAPPLGPWPTAAKAVPTARFPLPESDSRLARCPGYPLSDTHRSQPRSQPVNRAPAPLQTGFEPTFPPTEKRPPFCQFD